MAPSRLGKLDEVRAGFARRKVAPERLPFRDLAEKHLATPRRRASLSARGHSLMVKFQPSKLAMRVRFPLPAGVAQARSRIELRVTAMSARGNLEREKTGAAISLVPLVALGLGFWLSFFPHAHGRDLAPAEMIQAELPSGKTMRTANRGDLLFGLCRAVRKHEATASAITSTAVAGRNEFAGAIVGTVLRCSGKKDCEFAGAIVAAAVAAAANSGRSVGEAALAQVPPCADTIRQATQPPGTRPQGNTTVKAASPAEQQAALVATSPTVSEHYDPLEPLRLVCDEGTQRILRQSQVQDFLQTHPGAFLGRCRPKPSPTSNAKIPQS